jgi:hypothetical protein
MLLLPPGGFKILDEGRSVKTFPEFILSPLAKVLFVVFRVSFSICTLRMSETRQRHGKFVIFKVEVKIIKPVLTFVIVIIPSEVDRARPSRSLRHARGSLPFDQKVVLITIHFEKNVGTLL